MPIQKNIFKNTILILGALLALLMALPNLYSERPAIQVQLSDDDNAEDVRAELQSVLEEHKLAPLSINKKQHQIEISFDTTDNQLAARDILKKHLGEDYTVALNLVAATPKWLNMLGFSPMKQGLDLRGGVHFLLQVDVKSIVQRKVDGIAKNIRDQLRQERIKYNAILFPKKNTIEIKFSDSLSKDKAWVFLNSIRDQIDIKISKNQIENALLISLTKREIHNTRQTVMEQTMSILRNRVNELGIGEAVVQQQGATRIAVDLPGIQDAARAKQILGGTATLEFHLVDNVTNARRISPGSKKFIMDGQPIVLKKQVVLSGNSISSAISAFDQQTASSSVQIQLSGGRDRLFTRVTQDNIGKRMAIVYVETKNIENYEPNGKKSTKLIKTERVISAPIIQNALGNNFQITGLANQKEASNLALLLRAGALPTVIYPIEERTVGPSLGKENIHRGLVSLEVGMGLILILMLFYYQLFGLIANIGLFLNLIYLTAALSLMGATLTLPGIAGFVLTVGMAVDANVLINERIREELRLGVRPQMALKSGYERAFGTILDANITTFIVGLILFTIGSGPVKGFAIILCVGLLTSMLTSITYTKAIVFAYYSGDRQDKKLSIGI